MRRLHRLACFFTISSIDPDVMVPQIAAFTKQAPLLYIILNINVIALAYTHFSTSPFWLTVITPAVLVAASIVRILTWLVTSPGDLTTEEARSRLVSLMRLTVVLGGFLTIWALCLYPYGDAYARSHVAFFGSITVIGCIFCLMHIRPAALMLTAIVAVPFVIRFATTGEPVLTAIALNFSLVVVIMVYVLFVYYRDFTNLVHSQTSLIALSNLDSLTELPNRRLFFTRLVRMIEATATNGSSFALGIIDLDGFKPVNDTHGHAAGDRVLIEVGRRLRETLGQDVLVARLGGDEFAFMTQTTDLVALQSLGDAICEAVQAPIRVQGGFAQVAASVGFALYADQGMSQDQLIERADYALYFAKMHRRGTAVIFSASHETAIRKKSRIENELRTADLRTEMCVVFQPIVEVARDRIIACEALARWKSPSLGDVPPIDFIAAAERTGLIKGLTEILFAKALDAMRPWPRDVGLSFNLSVRDIAAIDLIARVKDMIDDSGIEASRICFEITETALMHDFKQGGETILALKAIGAKIALDDFGTGYSSLNYVHRLPLDKIKIDRSFVGEIATSRASRDIVKSIVSLCRDLDIICVVEGVETSEQMLILETLGCVTMQGYLFGRPAPHPDFAPRRLHYPAGYLAKAS